MNASLVVDYHLNNGIFDIKDKNINRDNCTYSIWLLKQALKNKGVELSTCDIIPPLDSDFSLCFDLPSDSVEINPHNSYLFLFESKVIKPKSWDKEKHKQFKRVFTWNDELVDQKKYFKFNYAHLFPENEASMMKGVKAFNDKKLCTLISANKTVNHPLELYSERVLAIRWFEQNAADDFDLFGIGWDKYTTTNRYFRFLLSKLPVFSRIIASNFPSYRGKVDSKCITMNNYKFAICYENAQMLTGYISEKIFDCFFSGCIPIYWGAPNISEHIPKECFIDKRDFPSYDELFTYLKNMSEKEYIDIQNNIKNYIFSERATAYKAESFADTVVDYILADFKK